MIKSYFIKIGLIAIAALFMSGCSSSPYYAQTSMKSLLPNKGKTQLIGEATFKPQEEMFKSPVGYQISVKLKNNASFSIIGQKFNFTPDDILIPTRIKGKSSKFIPEGATTFCSLEHIDKAKLLLGLTTLGLSSVANRTKIFSEVCFIDANRDHMAEQVILTGVKNEKDATPINISPTSYEFVRDEPLDGKSFITIVYNGKAGLFHNGIEFILKLTEFGKESTFDNGLTRVSMKEIPKTITMFGAIFTIESFNPADNSIKVNILKGFNKSEYGFTLGRN